MQLPAVVDPGNPHRRHCETGRARRGGAGVPVMCPGTVTRPGSDEPGGSRSGQQQAGHAAGQAAAAPAAAMGLGEEGLGLGGASGSWPGRGDDRTRRPVPSIEHGTTMTRTMFDVNIDRSGPVALHDQVAAQIRRAIADGEPARANVPLAKDLAAVLGVNKNTVLRALHVLRKEGLLEFRRGRGITVAGTPERGAVLAQVRNLLEFARQQGYGRTEIIQMISDLPQDA